MHDIEPYYSWRDYYIASEDEKSPFFGREYSEFEFFNRIYNYVIHPQWDEFGSPTLYGKILYVDYDEGFAILEMIGEWNDCITNDVMYLKRNIIDRMQKYGIKKFILICENVLNYHGDEDCYYEEWWEDVMELDGWIALLNLQIPVEKEMIAHKLDDYLYFGDDFCELPWRRWLPKTLLAKVESLVLAPRERKIES